MKQDRFLTGILIGVGVLVITAVALFFIRDTDQTYLDEGSPEAVVLNYVLALQNEEYDKAYAYLADEYNGDSKPGFAEFRSHFSYDHGWSGSAAIKIISIDQEEGQAWVNVNVVQSSGSLFGGVYRSRETAILVTDDAGEWKLIRMPYQFWAWEWFERANIYR
jgi:hypothetical protein